MSTDGVGAPGTASASDRYRVPPRPPDDGEAWYAPGILAQRTVHPGVVTTVRDHGGELRYETREPELSATGGRALEQVLVHFEDAELRRPLTREAAEARVATGLSTVSCTKGRIRSELTSTRGGIPHQSSGL
ncbi:MAG: hypothetical protein V5A56_14830 [Halolamina sp.]